jgi:hypothetical protein
MVDERLTNARGQRVPCRARAAIVGFSDDRRLVVSVVLVFVFVLKIFFVRAGLKNLNKTISGVSA